MFCLKNLKIKPKIKNLNLKKKTHLKAEGDQNLKLLKLSIKKAQIRANLSERNKFSIRTHSQHVFMFKSFVYSIR